MKIEREREDLFEIVGWKIDGWMEREEGNGRGEKDGYRKAS